VRIRGRTDANQKAIVAALRQIGCSVVVTSQLGNGFPDLVVGRNGHNLFLECKDGNKPPSGRMLTTEEIAFKNAWRGQLWTVFSLEEAVNYVLRNT